MRVLILCREPGLREALCSQFRAHKSPVVFLACDWLADAEFLQSDEPALIVDALAAEPEPAATAAEFLAQIMRRCRARAWPWLMLSDSRVFASSGRQRCAESDVPSPSAGPGEHLLARERYLVDNLPQHLILRTGSIIAARGCNLLTHFLQQFRVGGLVPASETPRFAPTPALDVARVIGAMCDQVDCAAECWGIYHYQSADITSSYEFAEVLLAAAAQYWDISSDHVQLQARASEPLSSLFPLLNCQRIRDTFGIQQLTWRRAIPLMLKQIYTGASS